MWESYEDSFRIRYRIDGKLVEMKTLPIAKKPAVISRLKIMADLDIAEKRQPQDGRIRMKSGDKTINIRVSTLPTNFGEKVVLRILDNTGQQLSLDALGLTKRNLEDIQRILKMPNGLVLVTGPTGSGKTTTLYAALNFLNQPDINITTIEDPIEYNLPGINQTMVRTNIGLSFAAILRTVLRQDPNVIMVGEIRDQETADIAVRAALTGHLVLSTLHTNDAASTIMRLMDMGIKPFLLASALRMIIAQRLVRKICSHCKRAVEIDWDTLRRHRVEPTLQQRQFFSGAGCRRCNSTGYVGREVIMESLLIDDAISALISRRATIADFRSQAKHSRFDSLRDDGIRKAAAGITSLSEVLSETGTIV